MKQDGRVTPVVSRRGFVATATGALATTMISRTASALESWHGADDGATDKMLRRAPLAILFQGDSITDASRSKPAASVASGSAGGSAATSGGAPSSAPPPPVANSASALGYGYPLLAAAELLRVHPSSELRIFNRGVSGNRVPDLAARWADDTIALKPDILSILVGVNDLWHRIMGQYNGTVADYETGYAALLAQTKSQLPNVRLVVLEPFVLRTGAVTDAWFPEFDQRRAAAQRVAIAAGATFIPLQGMFDKLLEQAPPAYWAADGVHPTPAGHAAIAKAWIDAVRV